MTGGSPAVSSPGCSSPGLAQHAIRSSRRASARHSRSALACSCRSAYCSGRDLICRFRLGDKHENRIHWLGRDGQPDGGKSATQRRRLVVFNRTPDKAASHLARGAIWADTPASLGAQVQILFTMLADPSAVHEAALGNNGFLDRLPANALWIDCSTVNPSFSREMALQAQARTIRFLDAPVAGSRQPAARGELTFFVGGDAADLEECRHLLQPMGSKILHVGAHGMGSSLKMVNNLLLATSMAAFAEGLVLGEALGISLEELLDFLLGTALVASYLTSKREKIELGDYAPEFTLQWMEKDLRLAAVSAHETAVALPVTNATRETYQLAARQGHEQEDFSAVYAFLNAASPARQGTKARFSASVRALIPTLTTTNGK